MNEEILVFGYMLLYGFFGQLVRVMVGLYKRRMEKGSDWRIDQTFIGLSLLLGGIVGVVGGVMLDTVEPSILIPLGYAGVDAIEGLFNKRIRKK